jgi:hypothetical protein
MVRIHAMQPFDSQGFTNKISARNEKFLANFEAQKIRALAQIDGLKLRRKFVTSGCAPHENHSLYARRD